MRLFTFLIVALSFGVACSGGPTDTVQERSVDIGATVEAAVEATRGAERGFWTLVPTSTLTPTATSVPTATVIPTPEPYVASPGSIERGMEAMSRCLREDEAYGDFVVAVLAASGDITQQEAEANVVVMANEELMKLAFAEVVEEDPYYAQMLSLFGENADEMCPSDPEPSRAGRGGSGASGDVGLSDGEVVELAGELYDCFQVNEEFADRFWANAEDNGWLGFAEGIMSDRRLFVDFIVRLAVVGDWIPDLRLILEWKCR